MQTITRSETAKGDEVEIRWDWMEFCFLAGILMKLFLVLILLFKFRELLAAIRFAIPLSVRMVCCHCSE